MKKLLIPLLALFFIVFSCEEPDQKDISPESNNGFTFTDKEVNQMLIEKFGHTNLTFEEKAKFLSDHIVSLLGRSSNLTESSGRISTEWSHIYCIAGTYSGGTWTFNTDEGESDELVHASKTAYLDVPQQVGATSSIYGGDGTHYYEQLAIQPVSPTYMDCGSNDIELRATTYWLNAPYVYANVDCDD